MVLISNIFIVLVFYDGFLYILSLEIIKELNMHVSKLLLSAAVAMGTLGIISLFAESKAVAAGCPSASTQTTLRGTSGTVVSQVSGFASAFYYGVTTTSGEPAVINQVTTFLPGAIKNVRGGTLNGFIGSGATAYTSYFVLPGSNPGEEQITITIYDIQGRKICSSGFNVIVP